MSLPCPANRPILTTKVNTVLKCGRTADASDIEGIHDTELIMTLFVVSDILRVLTCNSYRLPEVTLLTFVTFVEELRLTMESCKEVLFCVPFLIIKDNRKLPKK